MAQRAPLHEFLLAYIVGMFWAIFMILSSILYMIKYGPLKFFKTKTRSMRPACLDDPSLGVHAFMRLKSVKLHYVSSGPEGKPLMVFLHGFPEFWYSWRHQIRAFNKDYRCVAVDMRGYGESDKPQEIQNYIVENIVEDLHQLVIGLGYEKCTLVAHDWGGIIAMHFTHFHQDMVQRLVLCNIGHDKALKKLITSNMKQFLMSWYAAFFQLPYLPEILLRSYDYGALKSMFRKPAKGSNRAPADADDIEAYKWSMSRPGCLTCSINYYRAAVRYKSKELPKTPITCPTLMVWGTQDTALCKGLASMSAKYFSDYTVKYVETSGHWVQMEAPKETNSFIRELISRKKRE